MRMFFTFGSAQEFPFAEGEFVEVDADTEEQCTGLFDVMHPSQAPELGGRNCEAYFTEKSFVPVYKERYRGKLPVEVISVKEQSGLIKPALLTLDQVSVGREVWIEDQPDDLWAQNAGFAECYDNGINARRNRGAYEFYGCGNFKTYQIKDYMITWRCWDRKPGFFARVNEQWRKPDEKGGENGSMQF